jgi:hypothetical protein
VPWNFCLTCLQVMDVAQALTNILTMPSVAGTYNLPGPSTLTYEYLLDLVSTITYRKTPNLPVLPKAIALLLARNAQRVMWWPTLSPDEVERRYLDDADLPGDWDTFGVQPTEIEPVAITYLRRYRSAFVSHVLLEVEDILTLSILQGGLHASRRFPRCAEGARHVCRPLASRPVEARVECISFREGTSSMHARLMIHEHDKELAIQSQKLHSPFSP